LTLDFKPLKHQSRLSDVPCNI